MQQVGGLVAVPAADGLALSADGGALYWQALTGRTLYRIDTAALLTDNPEDAARGIEKVGATHVADGLLMSSDGILYLTAPEDNEVRMWTGDRSETVVSDDRLSWPDSLAEGPDGSLYLNGVSTNKLFRLAMNADGTAGALTELALSEEIKGPDGMRFGEDGVLYLAQNAAAKVSAVTFEGDKAILRDVGTGEWDSMVAVTKVGSTLWALDAKLSKLGSEEDPGAFYAYPVALQ